MRYILTYRNDKIVNEARLPDRVPRLRRYAPALIRQPDDADDLVQATLERAWLFTLMHNLYVDQLRRPTLTLVQLQDDVADAAATTTPHDGRRVASAAAS